MYFKNKFCNACIADHTNNDRCCHGAFRTCHVHNRTVRNMFHNGSFHCSMFNLM